MSTDQFFPNICKCHEILLIQLISYSNKQCHLAICGYKIGDFDRYFAYHWKCVVITNISYNESQIGLDKCLCIKINIHNSFEFDYPCKIKFQVVEGLSLTCSHILEFCTFVKAALFFCIFKKLLKHFND